jgi:hypothetical protein
LDGGSCSGIFWWHRVCPRSEKRHTWCGAPAALHRRHCFSVLARTELSSWAYRLFLPRVCSVHAHRPGWRAGQRHSPFPADSFVGKALPGPARCRRRVKSAVAVSAACPRRAQHLGRHESTVRSKRMGVDDACDVWGARGRWGEEAGRKPFTAVPSTVPFASQPSLLPLAPFARRWFATFGGGGTLELLSQPSEFRDLRPPFSVAAVSSLFLESACPSAQNRGVAAKLLVPLMTVLAKVARCYSVPVPNRRYFLSVFGSLRDNEHLPVIHSSIVIFGDTYQF